MSRPAVGGRNNRGVVEIVFSEFWGSLCEVVSDADIGKHKSRAHGRRDRMGGIAGATVAEAMTGNGAKC